MTESRGDYLRLQKDTEMLGQIFSAEDMPQDLNRTERLLLEAVRSGAAENKKLISTQLASRLCVTRSAISQTVDKMTEKGYIRRVPADNDKKIAYIELSDHEKEKLQQRTKECAELFSGIEKEMGEGETSQLFYLLEKFIAAAENEKKRKNY